jgi:hypothetical protein
VFTAHEIIHSVKHNDSTGIMLKLDGKAFDMVSLNMMLIKVVHVGIIKGLGCDMMHGGGIYLQYADDTVKLHAISNATKSQN